PHSRLEYGVTYGVTVASSIKALIDPSIHIAQDFTWNFDTAERKIIDYYPAHNSNSFGPDELISIKFNFDVDTISILDGGISVQYFDTSTGSLINVNPSDINYSYANREATYSKPGGFDFETQVFVDVNALLRDADGTPANQYLSLDFVTASEFMGVTDYSPFGSYVDPDADIWVKFVDNIREDSLNYVTDLVVYDCYGSVPGTISLDNVYKNILRFYPSFSVLESFCNHQVTVGSHIEGVRNQKRDVVFQYVFQTDGLSIDSVSFDTSYYDYGYISTDTDIVVNFSKEVFVADITGIYLQGPYGMGEYFSVSKSYDRLTITPWSQLDYDSDYTLVIEFNAVQGPNGEQLASDLYEYFTTEAEQLSEPSAALLPVATSSTYPSAKALKIPGKPSNLTLKREYLKTEDPTYAKAVEIK
ncbi:Ig-like domain-containing protein, partial [bacterium]|nr:Ig-like domain-containing protein [bacterium]